MGCGASKGRSTKSRNDSSPSNKPRRVTFVDDPVMAVDPVVPEPAPSERAQSPKSPKSILSKRSILMSPVTPGNSEGALGGSLIIAVAAEDLALGNEAAAADDYDDKLAAGEVGPTVERQIERVLSAISSLDASSLSTPHAIESYLNTPTGDGDGHPFPRPPGKPEGRSEGGSETAAEKAPESVPSTTYSCPFVRNNRLSSSGLSSLPALTPTGGGVTFPSLSPVGTGPHFVSEEVPEPRTSEA